MFENGFALKISCKDWDSVWEHAKEFQCVTKHAIQFKIICLLQITPYIRNKMDPKCSSDLDCFFHFAWLPTLFLKTIVIMAHMAQNKKSITVNVYVSSPVT